MINQTPKTMNNKKDATALDLEIFENDNRGAFRRHPGHKATRVEPRIVCVSEEVATLMGTSSYAAERTPLARSPADGSICLGIVPTAAARRGYAMCRTSEGHPLGLMAGNTRDRIVDDSYETMGTTKEPHGGHWCSLHPITD